MSLTNEIIFPPCHYLVSDVGLFSCSDNDTGA